MVALADSPVNEAERIYEVAAELFSLLSTPLRLRIISSLCNGEKSVGELIDEIACTQPNMSQHLNQLYRAGVVARKRVGQSMVYRIQNERAAMLCRAVCTQIAIEIDNPEALAPNERLLTARH